MKKYFKNEYTKIHFWGLFMILLAPFIPVCKYMVEETGAGNTAFEKEAKALVEKMTNEAKNAFAEHTKGMLDKKEFDAEIAKIKAELAKINVPEAKETAETITEMKGLLIELQAALKEQGVKITQQINAGQANKTSGFEQFVDKFLNTDSVKNFLKQPGMVGRTEAIKLADVGIDQKGFTISGNYVGTVGISALVPGATDNFNSRKLHMRELLGGSVPINMPNLVYRRLTNWINSAAFVASGEAAPNGANVTATEHTAYAKRIPAYMEFIEHELLNPLSWLRDKIMSEIPNQIRDAEDFAILYGDGSTKELTGLMTAATKFDFSTKTYAATAISSIATYASGTKTLVNFVDDHKLHNGWKITFANTTDYNSTYTVIYRHNRQIMIESAYSAQNPVAWTATCVNPYYHKISSANEIDCLIAATSVLNSMRFNTNVILANHIVRGTIQTLKNTQDSYLAYIGTDAMGNTTINGVPVIFTDLIDGDKFWIGELTPSTVRLFDYQPLMMWFVAGNTDSAYAKTGSAGLFAQEEILMPVYNPNSYFWGVFSDVITELTNPS